VGSHTGDTRESVWMGELELELRNGRDWSVGDAQLSLRPDSVLVRHAGRGLAVLDRDRFRDWLMDSEPEPLIVDDVVWSVQVGVTFLAAGSTSFRVTAESLSTLVSVI
jgi:hypothetical protein